MRPFSDESHFDATFIASNMTTTMNGVTIKTEPFISNNINTNISTNISTPISRPYQPMSVSISSISNLARRILPSKSVSLPIIHILPSSNQCIFDTRIAYQVQFEEEDN